MQSHGREQHGLVPLPPQPACLRPLFCLSLPETAISTNENTSPTCLEVSSETAISTNENTSPTCLEVSSKLR